MAAPQLIHILIGVGLVVIGLAMVLGQKAPKGPGKPDP
jgi:hypothetical protein